jgi:2-methylcitrate dehydratase PrpD
MAETLGQDLTGTLSRYASTLSLGEVPDDIVLNAKRLLLDTMGAILGATHTRMAPIAHACAQMLGAGDDATVAGRSERGSLGAAVYVNARLGNCMDLDETFPVGHHFGVGAVVAGLALAEARRLSGRDLLLALIAGYEVGGRLASAAGPPMFIADGKVTGYPVLYGFAAPVVFAAATAAIKLMRLDADTSRQVFGIAGATTPVPVMSKWSESVDLPDAKYAEAGWCSLAGVLAAEAARHGATGFSSILDGERGLLRMSGTESFDPDTLVGDLGARWMLADITYKPWPTCRWTHQPMTALAQVMRERRIDPSQVISVTIETNRLLCTPRFRNPDPRSFCSRQFSIPHAVAMMLLDVPVGAAWLDPARDADPRVASLRHKVEVTHFDRADVFAGHIVHGQVRNMPARAIVRLADGTTLVGDTEFALGDPWHRDTAYDDEAVIAKFRTASELAPHRADDLVDAVHSLEKLPSVDRLVGALRPAREVARVRQAGRAARS